MRCLTRIFLGALFSWSILEGGAQPNPAINSFTNDPICGFMKWSGGTGQVMVQKKYSLADPAWINVLTTSNINSRLPREAQNAFYRLQTAVTNTVLAFSAYLDGASEVPPVATGATGIGAFSLEGSNLTYYVSFRGLSGPATAAHFHGPGTPTNSASVMITLSVPAATEGVISGTVALTIDQITNFVNGLVYVNIHTLAHGAGEIHGQVVPLRTICFMDGASQAPPVTTAGKAVGVLSFIGSQLYYDITYTNLSSSATMAHIHGPAPAGSNNSVTVTFPTPSGTFGTISGSVSLTSTQMAWIVAGQTYLNIHTVNNSSGEVRGQIYPIQLGATLSPGGEVPPTASSGSGAALMNIISNKLSYVVTYTNLTSNANAGHIHGPASPTTASAPALIPFPAPSGTSGTISSSTVLSSLQLFYLISGQTYVNVHTVNNGGGEIRGQLFPGN